MFKIKLLVCFLIMSFSSAAMPQNSDLSLTITDMSGRQVSVPDHVGRLVCIGRGALRMVSYLHAVDKVVGVEFPEKKDTQDIRPYLLAYPKLRELPYIGYGAQGDPELIVNVAPQVIIYADGMPQAVETMQTKTGIPVINITCGDLGQPATFYTCLRLLATVLDKQSRCDSLITFVNQQLDEIEAIARNTHLDTLSVYIGGLIFTGKHGIGSTQSQYVPFQLLKLHNVAADIPGGQYNPVQVNVEQLLLWKPDVIYIDKACAQQVKEDFKKFPFLWQFRKMYELYPNRQYGENYETTLVNTFYMAYTLTNRDNREFMKKSEQIYSTFLNSGVWPAIQQIYGVPQPFVF